MEKRDLLYEGKAKKVYRTDNPAFCWVEFKDDATAFNGLKKGTIVDKGVINNKMSAFLFQLLEKEGIKTHFVQLAGEREMVAKTLQIFPVEVVMRNIAAGSLAKRLGLKEGTVLKQVVLEFYYKNDDLGDPLINDDHIYALELVTPEQLNTIKGIARKINSILHPFMAGKNLELVDFKLEFGLHRDQILLGDEISPDTCRFWDKQTREKLDKDRFRQDLGGVEEAYREVWRRLLGVGNNTAERESYYRI